MFLSQIHLSLPISKFATPFYVNLINLNTFLQHLLRFPQRVDTLVRYCAYMRLLIAKRLKWDSI